MSEVKARLHRAVVRWATRPDDDRLAPMAPLDAALALAVPVVILALLAPLAV